MFPRYDGVVNDLNALKAKIEALREQYRAVPDARNPKEERMERDLTDRFDTLIRYIDRFTEGFANDDYDAKRTKDRIWDTYFVSLFREAIELDGFIPRTREEKAEFAQMYESETARKLYDISQSIHLLLPDVLHMQDKANFVNYSERLDNYKRLREEYEKERDSFTELPLSEYSSVLKAYEQARDGLKEAKEDYKPYAGDYLDRVTAQYKTIFENRIKVSSIFVQREKELNMEILAMEAKTKEMEKNIENLLTISERNKKANEQYRKNQFDANFKKEAELKKELESIENELTTVNTNHSLYNDMYSKNSNLLKHYEDDKPDKGENPTNHKRGKEYVAALRKHETMSKFATELENRLKELGYNTFKEDEIAKFKKVYEDGKTLAQRINGKLYETMKKDPVLKETIDKIDFYNNYNALFIEMKERYTNLMKLNRAEKKELDASVTDPLKLRTTVNNTRAELNKVAEQFVNSDYLDSVVAGTIKRAWNNNYSLFDEMKNIDQELMDLGKKKYDILKKIDEVNKSNLALRNGMENDNNMNEVTTASKELEEHQNALKAKKKELADVKEQIEINDKMALEEKNNFYDEKWKALGPLERMDKCQKDIDEYKPFIDKFETFYQKHYELRKATTDLMTDLSLDADGNFTTRSWDAAHKERHDMWSTARHSIHEATEEFVRTANLGKKPGHTNSAEFDAMQTALENFVSYSSPLNYGNEHSFDDFVKNIALIKSAAVQYKEAKENQYTRFHISSQMRKTRLQYTDKLINFCDKQFEKLAEMKTAENTVNKKLADAKVKSFNMRVQGRDNVYDYLDNCINKRKKEEREREDQKIRDELEKKRQMKAKNAPTA